MTATVPGSPPAPPPPGDTPTRQIDAGGLAPAEQRGRCDVAGQVVEKIATGALGETGGVGGTSGTVGRMFGRADAAARPRVTAAVRGDAVRLDARISVAYPSPVTDTCDRAREHVVRQVQALTGLRVARLDITVSALTTPRPGPSGARELA